MMKRFLLLSHRWIAVVFAIPLAVVIVSGLVLAFEPIAHLASDRAIGPEMIGRLLDQYDPTDVATQLTYRNYDRSLELRFRTTPPVIVDIDTLAAKPALGIIARVFEVSRHLHHGLMLHMRWLVTASTAAMVLLVLVGVLMGPPRPSRTLRGWHRMAAWMALPLLVMLPVTGLLMVYNVTFTTMPMASAAAMPMPPVGMLRAVRQAGTDGMLPDMVWLRAGTPRPMLRHMQGNGFQGYLVMANRSMPAPRNWPRALHEGLWLGAWSSVLNALGAVVSLGLLVTGLILWLRRRNNRGVGASPLQGGT